jgi:regulatory protein
MMEQEKPKKKSVFTSLQAQKKAENYCAYQERSQQEVRDKLYSWGIYPNEVENIIAELVLTNFINEERFAMAYVSGKFKMNRWGKIKISQGLKMKGISARLIQESLNSIDMEEYLTQLTLLLEKKAAVLPEKDGYKRKTKLASFALGRGFESPFIFEILNNKDL